MPLHRVRKKKRRPCSRQKRILGLQRDSGWSRSDVSYSKQESKPCCGSSRRSNNSSWSSGRSSSMRSHRLMWGRCCMVWRWELRRKS